MEWTTGAFVVFFSSSTCIYASHNAKRHNTHTHTCRICTDLNDIRFPSPVSGQHTRQATNTQTINTLNIFKRFGYSMRSSANQNTNVYIFGVYHVPYLPLYLPIERFFLFFFVFNYFDVSSIHGVSCEPLLIELMATTTQHHSSWYNEMK